LPQAVSGRLFVRVARQLLTQIDEASRIGRRRFASNQQMEVIGHEAVRKNCKRVPLRGSRNLRQRPFRVRN
jgi:hypothetical protein